LFKVTLQTNSPLTSQLNQTTVNAYIDAANNQAGDPIVIQDAPVTNFSVINNLGITAVKSTDFILYPNPANEVVNVIIGTNTVQLNVLKLKVINVLGQTVEQMNIQNTTLEISTKNWGSSGIYFVKIFDASNNLVTTKKIILK